MSDRILKFFARLGGGVKCPKCGEKNTHESTGEVLVCRKCGERFSIHESMSVSSGIRAPAGIDPDNPPAGTRIFRCEPAAGVIGWEVPPSGKAGCLLVFAAFWLVFMACFTVLGLFAGNAEESFLGFVLISLPFWLVGFGMLYAGLRSRYAKHFIAIDADSVTMARILFNRTSRKRLLRETLQSVAVKEFYQQNYQPVCGVEIRGADGKIRFGSMLGEEEKHWLVADMRRVIWPAREHGGTDAPVGGESATRGARDFTVDFPPVPLAKAIFGIALGLVVVSGFIVVGIFALGDAGMFRWAWLTLNSAFLVAILYGARIAYRNSKRIVRVIGDSDRIRVQQLQHNLVVHEDAVVRTPGTRAKRFPTAKAGNSMVKIEILGDGKVVPVVYAYPESMASQPFGILDRALSP